MNMRALIVMVNECLNANAVRGVYSAGTSTVTRFPPGARRKVANAEKQRARTGTTIHILRCVFRDGGNRIMLPVIAHDKVYAANLKAGLEIA
jgi:hypothetical protein